MVTTKVDGSLCELVFEGHRHTFNLAELDPDHFKLYEVFGVVADYCFAWQENSPGIISDDLAELNQFQLSLLAAVINYNHTIKE